MYHTKFSLGNRIRVAIADDHPLTLSGLNLLVRQCENMVVIGLAVSPGSLFEVLRKADCDVLVTDLSMPVENEIDGLEMIRTIRLQFPTVAVVILTATRKPALYHALLTLGVCAIVHKKGESAEIAEAINKACEGKVFLGQSSAELMKQEQLITVEERDARQSLTSREVGILRLFSTGISANEIAKKIHRSIKTISHHKRSAMVKLKLETDLQLMRYFAENRLDDHLD
ncbi:response regulator transcription factor [Glaciimonas sp. PAMC28666]|uniref:response regulator transcription factor n=1 Tax=Glaciimonas sp. PAMC28666 TaxID=2807626 RepID=UPI00196537A1|nr:response regulator transcription factor [Glaciimonas sp. PAMC28666]QRX83189.1 response regulator transcription factor [Glaciimonas sp. PAMC28666]